MRRILTLLLPLACIALVGAGCAFPGAKKTASSPDQVMNALRQPAPPPAPTSEPVIPPEASKIPRPY